MLDRMFGEPLMVDRMSDVLLHSHIDLGDERSVIRVLQQNGYLARDILPNLDAALALTRQRAQEIRLGAVTPNA